MNTLASIILISLPLNSEALLYFFLFSMLVLSGVGLPVPEELTLLLGGYLSYLEFIEFNLAIVVLATGIVCADIMGYMLGKYAGGWFSRKFSGQKFLLCYLDKSKQYFDKYGEKVVLFSRPIMGVRVIVPMLAGHFGMNFGKFLMYDILGAVPWTILLVSLSYYLGIGLEVAPIVKEIKYGILAVIFLLVVMGYVLRLFKKKNFSQV